MFFIAYPFPASGQDQNASPASLKTKTTADIKIIIADKLKKRKININPDQWADALLRYAGDGQDLETLIDDQLGVFYKLNGFYNSEILPALSIIMTTVAELGQNHEKWVKNGKRPLIPKNNAEWFKKDFFNDLAKKKIQIGIMDQIGKGVRSLFDRFDGHLKAKGLVGKEGKIIDASFVDVPRQRNSRDENELIKAGAIPVEFGKNGHKLSQKDTDARWTKKGDEKHYGYKDHVKAQAKTKLIEDYVVTDASVHDSQATEELTKKGDGELHADSAYRSEDIEKDLKAKEIRSQVHERAYRNNPLTDEQKIENKKKSKVRVRVEHIFGHMTTAMRDGLKMRFIGLKRNAVGIGLLNLVYNMARYEQIMRLQLA